MRSPVGLGYWGHSVDRHVDRIIGILAQAASPCPAALVCVSLAVLLLAGSLTLFARLQRLPVEGDGWVGLGLVMSSPSVRSQRRSSA